MTMLTAKLEHHRIGNLLDMLVMVVCSQKF
jgi:hypothetical protein